MYPQGILIGFFALLLGAGLLYFGIKTPKGKKVNWGLGTYYDRFGICFRAIIILFIAVMALIIGFLV